MSAAAAKSGFGFSPLKESAECIPEAAGSALPWKLPSGFEQTIIAMEDIPQATLEDLPDMNQQNEEEIDMPNALKDAGVEDNTAGVGRLLYTTHEVSQGSSVSVADLFTGITVKLAEEDHWERFDGLKWTPWGTLLAAEETITASLADPDSPTSTSGLVYEIDPVTGDHEVKPQLGSLAHEGIGIDMNGNIYVIDENLVGTIYKFVPDVDPMGAGEVPEGQLYVLDIVDDSAAPGDRTGEATWLPLDRDEVKVSARDAAFAAGATLYNRPEDVDIIGDKLFVALTDVRAPGPVDNRVISISIEDPSEPFVQEFVVPGVNVPVEVDVGGGSDEQTGFRGPDNLAVRGDLLFIMEDNGPSDLWVAKPDNNKDGYSDDVSLFASMEDCSAEGTGIHWGIGTYEGVLFVNHQHAGPTVDDDEIGPDSKMAIMKKN
jgi:secreted PhoX family phosphatase